MFDMGGGRVDPEIAHAPLTPGTILYMISDHISRGLELIRWEIVWVDEDEETVTLRDAGNVIGGEFTIPMDDVLGDPPRVYGRSPEEAARAYAKMIGDELQALLGTTVFPHSPGAETKTRNGNI